MYFWFKTIHMTIHSIQKIILQIVLVLGIATIFFMVPRQSFAACQLSAGQFRTASNGINIQQNWYQQSVDTGQGQPYLYLDLSFTDDCINNSNQISFSIMEHDSFAFDPNDLVMGPYTLNITPENKKQTAYFRAGETWCDVDDIGDCDYFLRTEINGNIVEYSVGQVGQSSILNVEYDCHGPTSANCDDAAWQYLGTVFSTTDGYQYGVWISPNDPHSSSVQTGGQGDQVTTGGQGDAQTGGQGDIEFQTAVITEQIENPLGDGSSLPAFIQSLLGIVVRAGIPLVVLALVYTGFRFVEARGNPEKLSKAKNLLLYTVIGSAVVLGAWTIATILTNTINLIIS